MCTSTLRLREDVEVIVGMDDIPMIFDPVNGSYHRLSASARDLLEAFDGSRTPDDLVALMAGGHPAHEGAARAKLLAFLDDLEAGGLLAGGSPPPAAHRPRRFSFSRVMPRVVLTRSMPLLLEPLAAALRTVPGALAMWVWIAFSATGFAVGVWVLASMPMPDTHRAGPALAIAVAAQLFLVLLHELSHALVAQVQRVPVRALGFAMLFYFMPVAYVDRTDAYRVRGRGGRIAIAAAGMASDGIWCGVNAVLVLSSTGLMHQASAILLVFQLIGLMVNVNPLLPSDGYTIIEVAGRLIDARGRAFAILKSWCTRRPLPSFVASMPRSRKLAHAAYGTMSIAYIVVVASLVAISSFRTVDVVIQGAH